MYSMYAGDLSTAITEGSRLVKENPSFEYNYIPIALSRVAQGEVAVGRDTYAQLAQVSALGSSFASLGRADLEMYLGRHRDAVTLLRDGIAADRKSANSAAVAQKSVALAEAYLVLGDRGRAVQAANEAIKLSRHESTLFPAARVLGYAGQEEKAASRYSIQAGIYLDGVSRALNRQPAGFKLIYLRTGRAAVLPASVPPNRSG